VSFSLGPPLRILEENLWGLVELEFLWAKCPSCQQTISVKALKAMQSSNPNQWPGLILSSVTVGLLMEGVLCLQSHASTTRSVVINGVKMLRE